MKAAVWRIEDWRDSKYDDTSIKRVIFKGLDDNKTYYLNLNTKFPARVKEWEPAIKEGNVLDLDLQPDGKSVNYFNNYTIIRKV